MALRARKYFKDYLVRETVDPCGKSQKELVYCGDWYQRDCSAHQRSIERWSYLAASTAAAVMLLCAMLQRVEANISNPLVQAVSLFAMIPAFCVLEGSVEAFFRKGDLKKENYRERLLMLRVMGLIGAGLNLILFVGYGLDVLGGAVSPQTVMTVLLTGLNALIYGAIGIREIRVGYRVIKAPPRPKDGNDTQEEAKKYFD